MFHGIKGVFVVVKIDGILVLDRTNLRSVPSHKEQNHRLYDDDDSKPLRPSSDILPKAKASITNSVIEASPIN